MWVAIFKKELRLQRDFMVGALIVLTLLGGAGLLLVATGNMVPAPLFLLVPIVLHFLFVPVYMLSSLKYEWKQATSTWMQMPLPGWKLLLAKLSSGMVYFLGSFTISALFLVLALRIGLEGEGSFFETLHHATDQLAMVGRSYLFVLGVCLYYNVVIAPTFILYSVLRQWLSGTVAKFAGFLTLVLFAGTIWLFIILAETNIYQALAQWGEFSYHVETVQIGPLYTGEMLYEFLLSILFLALSGWLIDRKVQV